MRKKTGRTKNKRRYAKVIIKRKFDDAHTKLFPIHDQIW